VKATPVKNFANLPELAEAYFRNVLPISPLLGPGPNLAASIVLAAPAIVADWLAQNAPELSRKSELRIAVVSSTSSGFEALDEGRWYAALSEFLGEAQPEIVTNLVVSENLATKKTVLSALNLPLPEPSIYRQPFDEYLASIPEGSLDLLLLADADAMSMTEHGPERLAATMRAGTRVLALAASPSEFLLISGLLGTRGFESPEKAMRSRFTPKPEGLPPLVDNLEWGSQVWELTAQNRVDGTIPGTNLEKEARRAVEFVRAYTRARGAYPALEIYGTAVKGQASPAKDGRELIVLPENLYFDHAAEKLYRLEDGELTTSPKLDEYAASSALLSAYEGRATRFSQLLWAIHVFAQCDRLLPQAEAVSDTYDEEADEDEGEVCPGCGHVHTTEDRVEATLDVIEHVLEDESPVVRLQAALQAALNAAEELRSPRRAPDEEDVPDPEDLDDLELYTQLLNRGYLRAAFGMMLEDPDLDVEGFDNDGWPLAISAVAEGEFKLLEEMLDAGLEPTLVGETGWTIFHAIAALSPQLTNELPEELISKLCAVEADPNDADEDGERPLETAAFAGNWRIFEQLLKAGARLAATRIQVAWVLERMRSQGAEAIAERLEPELAGKAKRTIRNRKPKASDS
jgi:hypothetical protein